MHPYIDTGVIHIITTTKVLDKPIIYYTKI